MAKNWPLRGLPRLLRRGLIEAPADLLDWAQLPEADFPGYFAGASLKPPPAGPGGDRRRARTSPATSPGPH